MASHWLLPHFFLIRINIEERGKKRNRNTETEEKRREKKQGVEEREKSRAEIEALMEAFSFTSIDCIPFALFHQGLFLPRFDSPFFLC